MSDSGEKLSPISLKERLHASPPERYTISYNRYRTIGGTVNLDAYRDRFLAAEPQNVADVARLYFLCLAEDQITKEKIAGDIAELGVYKGGTATVLASIARQLGRTAYLLDTYEGFNEADLVGVDSEFGKGFTDTSLQAVRAVVGEENAQFIKGYFPETASQIPPETTFCLVHLDCDLYAPMRSALEFFYPRLEPGGYLIMHDYSSLHWGGAEKAVDEFFAGKTECVMPLTDSGGSVAIRKARTGNAGQNWLAARRLSPLSSTWIQAGGAGLTDLFDSGWSTPEGWGIWGVGPSHTLKIFLRTIPENGLKIEAETNALLAEHQPYQEVAIFVGGEHVARWTFEPEQNRKHREFDIGADILRRAVSPSDWGLLQLTIEFRPKFFAPANELNPSSNDDRTLGLALLQFRLQPF